MFTIKGCSLIRGVHYERFHCICFLKTSRLQYGKGNASIFCVALPLMATPKLVKRGKKNCIYLCKRTKVKIIDMVYLRLLRVRTEQCNYSKLALPLTATPNGVIKRGNKIDMYLCKKAMLKPVSYRTLGFSEYGMTKRGKKG